MANYLDSKEIENNEFGESLFFLKDELKLLKRSFLIWLVSTETGEKEKFKLRYCLKENVDELITSFYNEDFDKLLSLTNTDENNSYATKLECRYIPSGKFVCIQIYQDRPHEGGRSVCLTPARVYKDCKQDEVYSFAERA